ncbi:MAG: RluA family pseudouridine synthase [Alphaproteobacteria bacterium]
MSALSASDIEYIRSLVIHADDFIIAFNKPSGLSSQGGRIKAHTLDDLIGAFTTAGGNKPRLVHRLDRDTSGVIITARTKPAAAFLGKALMGRKVMKTYLAIVAPGAPQPRQGAIDAPLRREEIGRESYMRVADADDPEAQAARTLYRTLASSDVAALVEARPQTGRMHQIRVHLAHLRRPIVGDPRYGGALMLAGEPVPRLMLHAASIEFSHPIGGRLKIEAPIPPDFAHMAEIAGVSVKEPQAGGSHSTPVV